MRQKTTNINMRITEVEKKSWQEFANKRGQTLSEFIRFVVNMKIENNLNNIENDLMSQEQK